MWKRNKRHLRGLEMTTTEKVTLSAIIVLALTLLTLFGGVSQKDIAKCQETTNYSAERCLHEIAR
jgi:hypothetical protein